MVRRSVARSAVSYALRLFLLLGIFQSAAHAQTTCSNTGVTGVPAQECQALVDLYNATDGAHWLRNNGWFTESNVCSWDGIECSNGHINVIHLVQNNLIGTLPTSIGDLSELTDLRLASRQYDTSHPTNDGLNQLSGTIPTSIGNLTHLHILDLMENQFAGPIPDSIGNLVDLTELGLRGNLFNSSIPATFENLTLLTSLDLRSAHLTGSIPPELGNLTNLTALHLGSNNLSGSIPPELGNLHNVQIFVLEDNELTGQIPDALSGLTSLRVFHLHSNKLEGSIPDIFGGMNSLQSIDIGNQTSAANLTGPLPPSIFTRTTLVALRVINGQLSGTLPHEIANLTLLRHLQLDNNNLECEIPAEITGLSQLSILNIRNNQLFATDPATINFVSAFDGSTLPGQRNDNDDDGTFDCVESCPNDPNKTAPGQCGCGVPDTDTDGDGIADCVDHETPVYTVSGTVRLRNGSPLEGVTVRSRAGETVTDINGRYTIRNIPAGSYTFYVREWDEGYSISRAFKMNLIPGRNCPESELPLDDHLKSPECKFDPLLVDQNLTQMDFKVNRCINPESGVTYIEDENGHCIRENTPPSTPLNLVASDGTSTDGVQLSWMITAGATRYQIYRVAAGTGENPLAGTLVDEVPGVSFFDSSAVPGVHYDYVVRAMNRYGTSNVSNSDEGWRAVQDSSSGSDPDSDGDGVPDDQEDRDGTDPTDPGSFETVLRSPAFTKYNTFLSQYNWLELIGAGSKPVHARVTVYSIDGVALGDPISVTVNPQAEVDLDIHSRVPHDTYGIVRIEFDDRDPAVRLVGRMTVYRRDPNQETVPTEQQTYSFAFTRELRNPTRGVTYGTANSIDPQGMGFLVPNWAEVVNLEQSQKDFTIRVYNQGGHLLSQRRISVAGRGEFDIQAGHEFGEGVYLVQIMPHDGNAKYLATVTRYSSNAFGGNEAETYNFAMPIDARVGTSDHQFVPMSNLRGGCWLQDNWVEVTNVRAAESIVDIRFRSETGQVIAQLPAIKLAAHAQEHFNSSAILDQLGKNTYGSVEIAPRDRGSVVVQSNFYYHDCEKNALQTAYSSRGQISGPSVQLGTFNRFLGMQNLMHIINTSSDNLDLGIELRNAEDDLLGQQLHSVGSYSCVNVDLSDGTVFNTSADSYGTVMLAATDKRKLVVENVRLREINGRVDFAIATGVR